MKYGLLIIAIVCVFFAAGCNSGSEITEPTSTQKETTSTTSTEPTTPKRTIVYPPKEIIVFPMYHPPKEINLDPSLAPGSDIWWHRYRIVYYEIYEGFYLSYVDLDEYLEFSRGLFGRDINEMALVQFVKHFDIQKEVFKEVVKKLWQDCVDYGYDTSEERFELPNTDVIYTFDNEIINAYYRRENPVEPDWSKTKTYDSYEAYLKANGKTAE